jgi:hypothetical protein
VVHREPVDGKDRIDAKSLDDGDVLEQVLGTRADGLRRWSEQIAGRGLPGRYGSDRNGPSGPER